MTQLESLYEDSYTLAINKPSGIVVFPEGQTKENTLIDELLIKYPELKDVGESPRYGIIHRLDKDTSGILLVAKTNEALIFFQKQFKNRTVEKKYIGLVVGLVKENNGTIKTLIGRAPSDKRKQKVYLLNEPLSEGKKEAITKYKVLQRFKDYTLFEVKIETGRRHQIRCHFAYIQHPIAGDKMYGFKNSPAPKELHRQFLHATYLKIMLPNGNMQEFNSPIPADLEKIINTLEITD